MVERAQLLSLRRAPGSDADHLRPECVPLVLGGIMTTNEQSKGVSAPGSWDPQAVQARLTDMRRRARERTGRDVTEYMHGLRVTATHYQHSGACVMGLGNRAGLNDGAIMFALMKAARRFDVISALRAALAPSAAKNARTVLVVDDAPYNLSSAAKGEQETLAELVGDARGEMADYREAVAEQEKCGTCHGTRRVPVYAPYEEGSLNTEPCGWEECPNCELTSEDASDCLCGLATGSARFHQPWCDTATPEQECAHCGHPAHERYCTADECQCAFFATPERKP